MKTLTPASVGAEDTEAILNEQGRPARYATSDVYQVRAMARDACVADEGGLPDNTGHFDMCSRRASRCVE